MFSIPEVAPGGQTNGQSNTQQQVIASVVALQRVIAGQAGAEGGDASSRNFSGSAGREKEFRQADRARQRAGAEPIRTSGGTTAPGHPVETKSIVEAREASMTDRMIVAAFQARHGLTDLLSLIRDPDDLVLPTAPQE